MTNTNETTTGNMAKMREALTRVRKMSASYINCHDDEIDRVMTKIVATCDSALAEPPRNCDRFGTAEEQGERFSEFCDRYGRCEDCPIGGIKDRLCASAWAQMPYKEGEAK